MGFDDENNDNAGGSNDDKKTNTFFGLEIGKGAIYVIVIILALIFIRQISVVLQAL